MATVTITLYDTNDGGVSSQASFDPQIDTQSIENLSNAQRIGMGMLSHAFPPNREDVTWRSRNYDKE